MATLTVSVHFNSTLFLLGSCSVSSNVAADLSNHSSSEDVLGIGGIGMAFGTIKCLSTKTFGRMRSGDSRGSMRADFGDRDRGPLLPLVAIAAQRLVLEKAGFETWNLSAHTAGVSSIGLDPNLNLDLDPDATHDPHPGGVFLRLSGAIMTQMACNLC